MKKKFKSISIPLFTILLASFMINESCYYDSEEFLFPELPELCDTSNITFSGTVQPILNQHCLICHGDKVSASLGSNIKLDTYENVILRVQDGKLIGAITHSNGYTPMPKDASQLDDCKIKGIQKWIDNGSLNN